MGRTRTEQLDAAMAAGEQAWPELAVDPERARAHLSARLGEGLEPARAAELYLCAACLDGDPEAIAAFDKLLRDVGAWISRLDSSASFADEVRQTLREKLLVAATDGEPKLGGFSGRGPLGGWLRAASVRTALHLLRARGAVVESDGDASEPVGEWVSGADPELKMLRERYRTECQAALSGALARLTSQQRSLLKLHHLQGLSLDQLAKMNQVHRATLARWLADARRSLLEETRALLMQKLGASDATVDSLLGLVRGDLMIELKTTMGQ
ncbi:MAG: sigma-70 family RNA polymerase sigma factor [Deltaproteobacteria bacterium]|nr:sigma-70 family RNA polymerase sigma factor [Deltaproteobacteria bacterium]